MEVDANEIDRWTRALMVAIRVHRDHVDKRGQPYLLHVLRMSLAAHTTPVGICCALHDVFEMSDESLDDVGSEVPLDRVEKEALSLLTRDPSETYIEMIKRMLGVSPAESLAAEVKILDVDDHLRFMPPGPDWASLRKRYERAHALLWATRVGS